MCNLIGVFAKGFIPDWADYSRWIEVHVAQTLGKPRPFCLRADEADACRAAFEESGAQREVDLVAVGEDEVMGVGRGARGEEGHVSSWGFCSMLVDAIREAVITAVDPCDFEGLGVRCHYNSVANVACAPEPEVLGVGAVGEYLVDGHRYKIASRCVIRIAQSDRTAAALAKVGAEGDCLEVFFAAFTEDFARCGDGAVFEGAAADGAFCPCRGHGHAGACIAGG